MPLKTSFETSNKAQEVGDILVPILGALGIGDGITSGMLSPHGQGLSYGAHAGREHAKKQYLASENKSKEKEAFDRHPISSQEIGDVLAPILGSLGAPISGALSPKGEYTNYTGRTFLGGMVGGQLGMGFGGPLGGVVGNSVGSYAGRQWAKKKYEAKEQKEKIAREVFSMYGMNLDTGNFDMNDADVHDRIDDLEERIDALHKLISKNKIQPVNKKKTAGLGGTLGRGLGMAGKALGSTGIGAVPGAALGAAGGAIQGLSNGEGIKGVAMRGAAGAATGAMPLGMGFAAGTASDALLNKTLTPKPNMLR